jgi:hypothetical protein
VIAGNAGQGLPVTTGAIQPSSPSGIAAAGFVSKLDIAGQHLLFSTYFGALGPAVRSDITVSLQSVAVDSSNIIWLTGTSDPSSLPMPANSPVLGADYIAGLSPDGRSVRALFTAPAGSAGQSIAVMPGGLAVLGSQGSLLISSAAAGPPFMGITNSAGD